MLVIDGERLAERCVLVALAVNADGTTVPVGLWDGATESKIVVRSVLADVVSRGLRFEDGLSVVLDGANALPAAVREMSRDKALVHSGTLHKRRNVANHLLDKEKAWVGPKLVDGLRHTDADLGLRNATDPAGMINAERPFRRTKRYKHLPSSSTRYSARASQHRSRHPPCRRRLNSTKDPHLRTQRDSGHAR